MTDPLRPPAAVTTVDHLTGLTDRRGFMDALAAALAPPHEAPPLLLLDLDRFKAVNDVHGHPVGDALLVTAAGRIRSAVRRGDVVARLGGDEFAVLLGAGTTDAEAMRIADRLVDLLGRPFLLEGRVVQIGSSVGLSSAAPGIDAAALIKQADLALYAAKARGRGRAARFEASMQDAAEARMTLEMELRAALPLGQFVLHYQPLMDLKARQTVGFEALLRWQHPGRGLLAPGAFLPVAEEVNLMPAIGAWVLRQGCREAAAWTAPLKVSINVAPSQLVDGTLPAIVAAALAESGLPGPRLEIEVTENALIDAGGVDVHGQFQRLAEMGVMLALDDFGTGFASLAQLGRYPFQRVKIDRSFVADPRMMQAAMGVGRALGLKTTAEGIEEATHLAAVTGEGCEIGQGYLIGRPMAAAAISPFLHAEEQHDAA